MTLLQVSCEADQWLLHFDGFRKEVKEEGGLGRRMFVKVPLAHSLSFFL